MRGGTKGAIRSEPSDSQICTNYLRLSFLPLLRLFQTVLQNGNKGTHKLATHNRLSVCDLRIIPCLSQAESSAGSTASISGLVMISDRVCILCLQKKEEEEERQEDGK